MDLARGELFFTVDSDDLLTADALDKINQWEKTIPQCEKFCGFAGSDGDMTGKAINPIFSEEYVDATFFNRYAETGMFIGHDRPWVFYTDVHRQYRYPEFEGEKFIAEAVVWNRMAKDGYQIRCFNDVIYLIEHQEDGYTKKISQILIQSPKGYGLWKAEQMSFLKYGFLRRIKEYYIFYCDLQNKYHWRDIAKYIQASAPVMMFVIIAFKVKAYWLEEMMIKIAVIIPYFGKFPNYFELFLKSCKMNPTIDWIIFTDSKENYHYPANVRRIETTFEELKSRFQKKFDFKIALDSPYKLCDYKVMTGYLFEDYLEGYDYWGYSDVDMLFGDIRKFLLMRKYVNMTRLDIWGT